MPTRGAKRFSGNVVFGIYAAHGAIYTDSRNVAEIFGKNHQHVMRDIRNLIGSDIGPKLDTSFVLGEHDDSYGRSQPYYEMTRDGFALLAMGFPGATALAFKVRYIEQFNQMESALREGSANVRAIAEEVVAKAIECPSIEDVFAGVALKRLALAIAGYLVRARVNDRADPYYISSYMTSKHVKATLRNICKNIVGMANINAQ